MKKHIGLFIILLFATVIFAVPNQASAKEELNFAATEDIPFIHVEYDEDTVIYTVFKNSFNFDFKSIEKLSFDVNGVLWVKTAEDVYAIIYIDRSSIMDYSKVSGGRLIQSQYHMYKNFWIRLFDFKELTEFPEYFEEYVYIPPSPTPASTPENANTETVAIPNLSSKDSRFLCVRNLKNKKELLDNQHNVVKSMKLKKKTLTYKKVKVKKVKSCGFTKNGKPIFHKKNTLYYFKGKKIKGFAKNVSKLIFNDKNFAVKYKLKNGETVDL